MLNSTTIIIFIILILWLLILLLLDNTTLIRRACSWFTSLSTQESTLLMLEEHKNNRVFPFRYAYANEDHSKLLPLVFITAPLRSKEDIDRYYSYLNNPSIGVVGITAYKSFPRPITDNSNDKYKVDEGVNYIKEIKHWLACFNNPSMYDLTPDQHKIADISESDFYDVDESNIDKEPKLYDFIYVCLRDTSEGECDVHDWNSINRNYDLFLKCLPILTQEFGYKILVVGRSECGLDGPLVETTPFLAYHEFQKKIAQSRVLFVPNIYDASPRVIGEALSKNVAILINRSIICGTKYISPETGEWFTDEHDIRYAIQKLMSKLPSLQPSLYWKEHYGRHRSGQKLAQFLKESFPDILDTQDLETVYLYL